MGIRYAVAVGFYMVVCGLSAVAQTIATVAGTGVFGSGPSGAPATATPIQQPTAVATDAQGNFYFTSRSLIRKVDTAGVVTTVAGGGTGTADGIAATACAISNAQSLFIDANGVMFIADKGYKVVRKVDTTGLIYKVAGGGTHTTDGIQADSFQFSGLYGVVADSRGNVYMSDPGLQKIFRVDVSGIIHTFAGYGVAGWTGDGVATGAALNWPAGMAVDQWDNVYFADQYNQRIRKIDTSGIIATVVGSGYTGFTGDDGDALSASLDTPVCVAISPTGEIYFGDSEGDRVRYVDAAGLVHTIAGNGTPGYGGDNGPATAARLGGVSGIALAASGGILLADTRNNRVREITQWPLGITNTAIRSVSMVCYPNPVAGSLTVWLNGTAPGAYGCIVVSVEGTTLLKTEIVAGTPEKIDITGYPSGYYLLIVYDKGRVLGTTQVVKE